jgi:hypothetical protein
MDASRAGADSGLKGLRGLAGSAAFLKNETAKARYG